MIVGPEGELLAGPLVEEEGMVVARLDVAQARALRPRFDALGPSGDGLLRFQVDTRRRVPITWTGPAR